MSTETRKGYAKIADIPADVLLALSKGEIQAATLTESLAIDQRMLVATVFPELDKQGAQKIDALAELGILKRMKAIGEYLLETYGEGAWARCLEHPSDLVRGWASLSVWKHCVPWRMIRISVCANGPGWRYALNWWQSWMYRFRPCCNGRVQTRNICGDLRAKRCAPGACGAHISPF